MINTGPEGPFLSIFGNSKIVPTNIAMHPESLINNLGRIMIPKTLPKYNTKTRESNKLLNVVAVFWALLDTIFNDFCFLPRCAQAGWFLEVSFHRLFDKNRAQHTANILGDLLCFLVCLMHCWAFGGI